MRKIGLIIAFMTTTFIGWSQTIPQDSVQMAGKNHEQLKTIFINKDISTILVAMEDITLVDISVPNIVGDIATDNTLRIKPVEEGASGVLTIITERFMVQYLLVYTSDLSKTYSRINIPYSDLMSYINPQVSMTKSSMYDYAYNMFVSDEHFYDVSTVQNKMELKLNNIYTMDRYFFIDITLFNKSNIMFDIDDIVFRIVDKKQVKSTNVQSIDINPLMQLEKRVSFKKRYRNIFVFEKFTFPDEKVFEIEISEKQISGRTITLKVDYEDVLNADSFTK